jgi:hypothetical protein
MPRNAHRRQRSCCLLLLLLAGAQIAGPAPAIAQTANAEILVTAQVTNYCSIDSTALDLLSVTCSLDTPTVASATGATQASTTQSGAGLTAFTQGPANSDPPKTPAKPCDTLAAEKLENDSFNQFALNMAGHSSGPAQYFSTFEVCF